MIVSFKHKGLKRLYDKGDESKLDAALTPRIKQILSALDVMVTMDDVNFPTWRLHPLKGSRNGEWSLTVRANWRITFTFEDGDVRDVNLEDYHSG